MEIYIHNATIAANITLATSLVCFCFCFCKNRKIEKKSFCIFIFFLFLAGFACDIFYNSIPKYIIRELLYWVSSFFGFFASFKSYEH